MHPYSLLPGDRLLVTKAAVIDNAITHSGTYMGGGLVAHISPSQRLVVEPIEHFAGSQTPEVISNGYIAESVLWERFNQLKKKSLYRLYSNNCEHVSNFLETGISGSKQLKYGVAGLATGYFVVRASGIKNPWLALGLVGLTTIVGA